MKTDLEALTIIHYPDPRLRKSCHAVTKFDAALADLARRMLKLMHEGKGVGLAAPQVGVLKRLFVMNATDDPKNDVVLVNPVIRGRAGSIEAEEGCLSLPGINVNVRRSKSCRIEAQDLEGNPITLEGEELVSRVWQHETDHLDGVLIIDRMGPSDRMATKKTVRALEESYTGNGK